MIVVVGGTGRLGSLVVRGLRSADADVRVVSRDPARADHLAVLGIDVARADVRDASSLPPVLEGADVVVSAVQGFIDPAGGTPENTDRDGNRNLVGAAALAGVPVVLVSVVGAAADHPMELFRAKFAAEEHLRRSGVPWTVVRGAAFAETWLGILAQTAGRSGRPMVFGHGRNPVNLVCVRDMADAVVHAAQHDGCRSRTLEVGGPDSPTMTELATRLMALGHHDGSPRHLPPAVLRVMAQTVGRARPGMGRQVRAALAMDSTPLGGTPALSAPCAPAARTPVTVCVTEHLTGAVNGAPSGAGL